MAAKWQFEHGAELYASAIAEFVSAGYDQASINTILKNAGMSKGQFYYHFANKEALYMALIDILIARKKAFLTGRMRPEDFQQDIFSIFKIQIEHSLAFAAVYPEIDRFSESFLREKGNPIYKKALAKYSFEDNDAMQSLIAAAYQRGEFRPELPLAFVQKTIGHLFTHVGDLTDISGVENAEENLHYLIDFIKTGLARNP